MSSSFGVSLPLSVRNCRCGRAIDIFGHPRAACARGGRCSGAHRTSRCLPQTTDVWKLWLTVFLFSEGRLAIDTTLVCDALRRFSTPWLFSRRRVGGRSNATQNWWDFATVLDWWCSRWKLGAGGQLRRGLSFPTWPRHGLVKRCLFCTAWRKGGGAIPGCASSPRLFWS